MGQPYVGEIRMFGGNFAPAGWMFCDGQLLPISEYETLFNLIGTTYGGDGQSTFALPDLRSRVPLHMGSNGVSSYTLAETGGVEQVTLALTQIPSHSHVPVGSSATAGASSAAGATWAAESTEKPYSAAAPAAVMASGSLRQTGGNQPHDNMLPFLAVSFIISLFGVFPTQS